MVLIASTTALSSRMLLERNSGSMLLFSSASMAVGCIIMIALCLLQCLLMVNPRSFLLHSVSSHRRIKRTGRRFLLLFLLQVSVTAKWLHLTVTAYRRRAFSF